MSFKTRKERNQEMKWMKIFLILFWEMKNEKELVVTIRRLT